MSELKEYTDKLGITFLCTPFDIKSANLLESLDVVGYKVSSADLTNMPLIEHLATFNKPLILSTGMSIEEEVSYTVNFLKERAFLLLYFIVYRAIQQILKMQTLNVLNTSQLNMNAQQDTVVMISELLCHSLRSLLVHVF